MTKTSVGEPWTVVIGPARPLFDLRWRELWAARDLVMMLVWRDFVAVYKQTLLGPLWHVFQPLMTTLLFTLVFGTIVRIPTDGAPPILFYLSGMVVWTYFSACVTAVSETFAAHAPLFGKVYFPRLAVPIAIAVSKLMAFGVQFFVLVCGAFWYGVQGAGLLLAPVVLVPVMALALGLGMLVTGLTTVYRDLRVLVAFGVTLAMYVTPVIYPTTIVPPRMGWLLAANPLAALIPAFRSLAIGAPGPGTTEVLMALVASLVIFSAGLLVFTSVEGRFIDTA